MNETINKDLQDLLDQALQFHGSGHLHKAEVLYRRVLKIAPKQAVALHYLGTIALQVGQTTAAIELIEKAIAVSPDYVDAIGNLGNAQQSLGQVELAIKNYQRALTLDPNMAKIWTNLANARCQLNQLEEAVVEYKKALVIQPELEQTHRNLASALLLLDRPNEALQSISQALKLNPNSIEILVTFGNVLQKLSRFEDALECYQKILQQQPKIAEVHSNLANVQRELSKIPEATEHYQQALKLKPDYAEAFCNYALLNKEEGKFSLAETNLRKAITLKPYYAKAHHMLADLVKHTDGDSDIKQMEAILASSETNDEQKMYCCFGLGKSYDDCKQYQQSFEYYQKANQLRRQSFNYSITEDINFFSVLKATFTKELFNAHKSSGLADQSPIFIIGMPRSGTTLVEQILASHADVHGAGELMYMQSSIAEIFGIQNSSDFSSKVLESTDEMFLQSANLYLNKTRKIAPNTKFITDKLPMNFLNVGMIKLMFPNAKIIHCQRNPIATCFSIYKNLFIQLGHTYAYDQKELGTFYNLYLDLMEHWKQVLPDSIITIDYEKLVNNQEVESRSLLAACNLEWDPACLEFHKTKRQVSTISASQVRKPMYKTSVEKWQKYQTQLVPLIKILSCRQVTNHP